MPGLEPRPTREMSRLGEVPRPAPGSAFDADDAPARVGAALERIMLRAPEGQDVKEFGRYLFGALIEPDWAAMVQAAGDDGIELALAWDPEEALLHRLPWELMHGADGPEESQGFLAGSRDRPLAMSPNLVRGATAELDELPATLGALFVIGTDRSEAAIRPGREYLTLVQRLQTQGVSLRSRVLVAATRTSLQDELTRWRPTVLHFIGHGRLVASSSSSRSGLKTSRVAATSSTPKNCSTCCAIRGARCRRSSFSTRATRAVSRSGSRPRRWPLAWWPVASPWWSVCPARWPIAPAGCSPVASTRRSCTASPWSLPRLKVDAPDCADPIRATPSTGPFRPCFCPSGPHRRSVWPRPGATWRCACASRQRLSKGQQSALLLRPF